MPENISVEPIDATTLNVSWGEPATLNGRPTYIVYYINQSMDTLPTDMWQTLTSDATTVNIAHLDPYTAYSVRVSAVTSCTETLSNESTVARTNEAPPSPPRQVRVSAVLPRAVTLRWAVPESPNGNVSYNVSGVNSAGLCFLLDICNV